MNPMTDDELTMKFDTSVSMVLRPPEHEELRRRLWNLTAERDLTRIAELFRQFSLDDDVSSKGRS
jgi:hypothetical protein